MASLFQDLLIESLVFWSTSSRDHQGIVIGHFQSVKIGGNREIVPSLFTVSLLPIKIVNSRGDRIARLLVGTDRVDLVTDHQQHLEGNHGLVIFHVIPHEHQDPFTTHDFISRL